MPPPTKVPQTIIRYVSLLSRESYPLASLLFVMPLGPRTQRRQDLPPAAAKTSASSSLSSLHDATGTSRRPPPRPVHQPPSIAAVTRRSNPMRPPHSACPSPPHLPLPPKERAA
jgi:hypothetical protein